MRHRKVILVGTILFIILLSVWYQSIPTIADNPLGGEGYLLYILINVPLGFGSLLFGLVVLINHRFALRRRRFLWIHLALTIMGIISIIPWAFHKALLTLSPLKELEHWAQEYLDGPTKVNRPLYKREVYDAHYQFFRDRWSSRSDTVLQVDDDCYGVLSTTAGLVYPLEIYQPDGQVVGFAEFTKKWSVYRVKLVPVGRAYFDSLYQLTIPKACFSNGGYTQALVAGELVGIAPAIINILPSSTASGAVVEQ